MSPSLRNEYGVVTLAGVPISHAVMHVFEDFRTAALDTKITLDDPWLRIWNSDCYDEARKWGLLKSGVEAPGCAQFTPLGKTVFGLWLLLKESGHG